MNLRPQVFYDPPLRKVKKREQKSALMVLETLECDHEVWSDVRDKAEMRECLLCKPLRRFMRIPLIGALKK